MEVTDNNQVLRITNWENCVDRFTVNYIGRMENESFNIEFGNLQYGLNYKLRKFMINQFQVFSSELKKVS